MKSPSFRACLDEGLFESLASFKLHKWHSNVPELESPSELSSGETMFAKE